MRVIEERNENDKGMRKIEKRKGKIEKRKGKRWLRFTWFDYRS